MSELSAAAEWLFLLDRESKMRFAAIEQASHAGEVQRTRMWWDALSKLMLAYAIAVVTQIVAFPAFGLKVAITDNLLIGAVFTVVSIVRSYSLRRLFERFR